MFFESWFLDYRGAGTPLAIQRSVCLRMTRREGGQVMKRIVLFAVFSVFAASVSGCATGGRGGIFSPGAGERIIDTTLKGAIVGTVVGAGVGVLGEVFNGGGSDHRGGGVFVPGGHSGYYNSPAEAVNARRYRQQQWEEEERRLDAIHEERYHRRW